MSKTPIERIDSAIENERVRKDLDGALTDLTGGELIDELIEALEAVRDTVEGARQAIDTWDEADCAHDKADAREDALMALSNVSEAYEALGQWFDLEAALKGYLGGIDSTQAANVAAINAESIRLSNIAFIASRKTIGELDAIGEQVEDYLKRAITDRRAELSRVDL